MKHIRTYPRMQHPDSSSKEGLLYQLLEVCPEPVFIMFFRDLIRSKALLLKITFP